jgi:hypothetical protein
MKRARASHTCMRVLSEDEKPRNCAPEQTGRAWHAACGSLKSNVGKTRVLVYAYQRVHIKRRGGP